MRLEIFYSLNIIKFYKQNLKMEKLWINKEYKFNPAILLTEQLLEEYINLFWKNIISKISDNQHVLLLLKVKFEDNQIRTLNELQTINISSKDGLLQFFKDRLLILSEAYKVIPVSSLIFSYGTREGKVPPKINLGPKQSPKIKYQIYYRNELPIAMIPEDYGTILSKIGNNYTILTYRGIQNAIINLTVKNIGNKTVNHIRYIKNNNLLFSWTDTIVSLKDKKFIRRIGKSIIHYIDGEISLYTIMSLKSII